MNRILEYTTKTLKERQEEYDRARAPIFARISSNNKNMPESAIDERPGDSNPRRKIAI